MNLVFHISEDGSEIKLTGWLGTEISLPRSEPSSTHCSSMFIVLQELFYDDDSVEPDSGELERLTSQINDKLLEVEEMMKTSVDERKEESLQNKQAVDR